MAATWASSATSQVTPIALWPADVSSSVATRRVLVIVRQHDRGACLGEGRRRREPDAGAGASDECDLAFERHIHVLIPLYEALFRRRSETGHSLQVFGIPGALHRDLRGDAFDVAKIVGVLGLASQSG
jgi:hypothetical protein